MTDDKRPDLTVLDFDNKKKNGEEERKIRDIIVTYEGSVDHYQNALYYMVLPIEGLFQVVIDKDSFITYPLFKTVFRVILEPKKEESEPDDMGISPLGDLGVGDKLLDEEGE